MNAVEIGEEATHILLKMQSNDHPVNFLLG